MPDFDAAPSASELLELLRLNIAQPLDPLRRNMTLAEGLPLTDFTSGERSGFDAALTDLAAELASLGARVAAMRATIAGLG